MLARAVREDVRLVCDFSEDPALVRIDPAQFEQAMLNLVLNARDAMPDGGEVRIEIARVELDESVLPPDYPGRSSSFVRAAGDRQRRGNSAGKAVARAASPRPVGRARGDGAARAHGLLASRRSRCSSTTRPRCTTTLAATASPSGSSSNGRPTAPGTSGRRSRPATRSRAGCTARSSSATDASRSTGGASVITRGVRPATGGRSAWNWTAGSPRGRDAVAFRRGVHRDGRPGCRLRAARRLRHVRGALEHPRRRASSAARASSNAPRSAIGDLELEITPVAWSPVLLVHPDGREARFPRGLARVEARDGRSGVGWVEWNQPPDLRGGAAGAKTLVIIGLSMADTAEGQACP